MPQLYGRSFTRRELADRVGSLAQVAGMTEFFYDGGRGRGVRGVRINTGALSVEIVVDRALDVAHAAYRGIPFVWRSANDIASPAFYEPEGDEWLRSFFGGWLTTCGLGNFGPPGSDRWGTFGQHGRINNIPADEFSAATRWEGDRCLFEVRGTMREVKALGEKLVLRRTWATEIGSSRLHLLDRVTNEGAAPAPHMVLYHCNAGFPLLDRATRIYVSHSGMQPRDAQAEKGLGSWCQGGPPDPNFLEQVFIHEPHPCANGTAKALVANEELGEDGLGFEVRFDPRALPALFTWRMLSCGDYVMSVEPANTKAIQGRVYAQQHDLLPFLEPGEERTYELEFSVRAGDDLRASIAAIQSANATNAATR